MEISGSEPEPINPIKGFQSGILNAIVERYKRRVPSGEARRDAVTLAAIRIAIHRIDSTLHPESVKDSDAKQVIEPLERSMKAAEGGYWQPFKDTYLRMAQALRVSSSLTEDNAAQFKMNVPSADQADFAQRTAEALTYLAYSVID